MGITLVKEYALKCFNQISLFITYQSLGLLKLIGKLNTIEKKILFIAGFLLFVNLSVVVSTPEIRFGWGLICNFMLHYRFNYL